MGFKLLIEYLHSEHYIAFEIPKWLSLGLIVVIFGVSFLYARRVARRSPALPPTEAETLVTDEANR